MTFKDRSEAGKKPSKALKRYEGPNPVILALLRGGVPVAAEVAAALHALLDLVLVRKIGVPIRPELAIGAVVDSADSGIVRNEDILRHPAIEEVEFRQICDLELAEIERRRRRNLCDRAPIDVKERATIIIDDFIATGATTRAALRAIRMRTPKQRMRPHEQFAQVSIADLRNARAPLLEARPSEKIVATATADAAASDWTNKPPQAQSSP